MTLRNEPHDGSEAGPGPAVYVRFKSSSQPKGQDGYELAVSSDATGADVRRTMALAVLARQLAAGALDGTYAVMDAVMDIEPAAKDANREVKVDGAEVGYVGYV